MYICMYEITNTTCLKYFSDILSRNCDTVVISYLFISIIPQSTTFVQKTATQTSSLVRLTRSTPWKHQTLPGRVWHPLIGTSQNLGEVVTIWAVNEHFEGLLCIGDEILSVLHRDYFIKPWTWQDPVIFTNQNLMVWMSRPTTYMLNFGTRDLHA